MHTLLCTLPQLAFAALGHKSLTRRGSVPAHTQEEGQETDDGVWNVSMASGTCLALCASVAEDAIVPLVMPYVTANIQKADGTDR